jgi:hypothetical protein
MDADEECPAESELESWFIAAAEKIRGAKEWLRDRLESGKCSSWKHSKESSADWRAFRRYESLH